MGKKGIKLAIPSFLFTMIVIGVVLVLLGFLYFRFFDVRAEVQEADVDRHAYTLANVVLSSEQLIYFDNEHLYRGIFDKSKLDTVNQAALFEQMSYPASAVIITIEDLDSNEKWIFSQAGPNSPIPINPQEKAFQLSLPAVIRFSQNDYHIGKLTLKLTEKSLI